MKAWSSTLLLFTGTGAIASATVGALLAQLGHELRIGGATWLFVALSLAVVLLARELGMAPVPLPQVPRQTNGRWTFIFPRHVAAALWGIDIGLVFATWLTFGGPWILAMLALLSGLPSQGALIFVAYWAGRAISLWLAPVFVPATNATPQVVAVIAGERRLFQLTHSFAIGLVAVALATELVAIGVTW